MNNKTIILVLILSIISCSPIQLHLVNYGIFNEYVWRFFQYADNYNRKIDSVDLSITFVEDLKVTSSGQEIVGSCKKFLDDSRMISIKKPNWNVLTDSNKEILMFHELGHCLLNQQHRNQTIFMDGLTIPKSIMNAYLLGNYYEGYKQYYLEELFTYKGE